MVKKTMFGPTRGWRNAAGKKLAIVNVTGQLTLEQFTDWEIRALPGAGEAIERTFDGIDTLEELDEQFACNQSKRMQLSITASEANSNI